MNLANHPWIHTAGRLIGLILLISLASSFADIYRKQGIKTEFEGAYSKEKAENDRLKRLLAEAQTPEYVEREARNKLGLGKEGESLVLMDMSQIRGVNGQSQPQNANSSVEVLPTWKQWWKLFF